MKQELLEHLIRICVCEVLNKIDEADTKGAPAPPADGSGSEPSIPQPKPPVDPKPSQPETPKPDKKPESSGMEEKGILMVNPKNKALLSKAVIQSTTPDSGIRKYLTQLAISMIGNIQNNKIIISDDTISLIRSVASNPNSSLYLYLKKWEPNSSEIFVKADKSRQIAKDQSISSADVDGISPTITTFPSKVSSTPPTDQVNEELKKVVKTMVNKILNKK